MEKQRARAIEKQFAGLLIDLKKISKIFCLLIFLMLSNENRIISQNYVAGNNTDAEDFLLQPNILDSNLAGEEIIFSAFIPNAMARNCRVVLPTFPDDVKFISMRSYDFYGNGKVGVQIDVTLMFERAGVFSMPPVNVVVSDVRTQNIFQIPFSQITIENDIKNIQPEMIVRFEMKNVLLAEISNLEKNYKNEIFSVTEGDNITVSVFLRNAQSHGNISWQIPSRSLFTEKKVSENKNDYQLAVFEWIPLAAGSTELPVFSVDTISFSGEKKQIFSPELFVKVNVSSAGDESSRGRIVAGGSAEMFENAFYSDANGGDDGLQNDASFSYDDMIALSNDLRKSEKNMQLLKAVCVVCCVVAFLVTAVFSILTVIGKKNLKAAAAICAVFFLMSCTASVIVAKKFVRSYAVFAGETISVIPEDVSSINIAVPKGEVVTIIRNAGDWFFVETSAGNGWVKKDNILF